jgi:hypothetical protein
LPSCHSFLSNRLKSILSGRGGRERGSRNNKRWENVPEFLPSNGRFGKSNGEMIYEKFIHSSRSRKVNNVTHMQCRRQASSCGSSSAALSTTARCWTTNVKGCAFFCWNLNAQSHKIVYVCSAVVAVEPACGFGCRNRHSSCRVGCGGGGAALTSSRTGPSNRPNTQACGYTETEGTRSIQLHEYLSKPQLSEYRMSREPSMQR